MSTLACSTTIRRSSSVSWPAVARKLWSVVTAPRLEVAWLSADAACRARPSGNSGEVDGSPPPTVTSNAFGTAFGAPPSGKSGEVDGSPPPTITSNAFGTNPGTSPSRSSEELGGSVPPLLRRAHLRRAQSRFFGRRPAHCGPSRSPVPFSRLRRDLHSERLFVMRSEEHTSELQSPCN